MTGWQQDPYGDPYGQPGGQYGGGQYGADPYGNQYGADPYGGSPYGADPYGANPYGPGQTAAYPAYQAGFGPPPEPPKRSKMPIVLSIVAILAVVGTVVTIVLLNRGGEEPSPTAGGGPTSSSKPRPTSLRPPTTSRRPPTSSTKPSGKDGWTTIDIAGGSYQVPGDWKSDTSTRPSGLGIDFSRGAVVGNYECGGSTYFRGFAAAGDVQGKDGAPLDLTKAVSDFAASFAKEYYRNPTLDAPAPKPATVSGKKAATVTVKLAVTPTKPECEATSGEVALVGVEIEKDGKPAGVRMVVVVNDLAGGPATPPGLPDSLAEEILGTVTVE